MPRNLPMFIIASIDMSVTCYGCGGGKSCISIDGDHKRHVVGASGSELVPSGRGRPQVVKTSER